MADGVARSSDASRGRTPGIKEVAAAAGVSLGTVSNVLNRPEQVAEPTRARVLAAIDDLGFVRNGSASQLRAGRSRALGLLVLDIGNPFFTDVARGVEQVAAERGMSVLLCNSDGSPDRQNRHLQFLEEQRVAGLLVTPVSNDLSRLARLRTRGTPVVLVDEPGGRRHCSVAVDDRAGGEFAGRHLRDIGRRRVVYVTGPDSVRQCVERGIGLREGYGRTGRSAPRLVGVDALNGEAGFAAVPEVLAQQPDAVFCANDVVALGVLRGLLDAGVRVPQDVALLGYDDIEFARTAAVPLTTVRQPALELGRSAARLLLEECTIGTSHRHKGVLFEPELVVRQSTLAGPASAVG